MEYPRNWLWERFNLCNGEDAWLNLDIDRLRTHTALLYQKTQKNSILLLNVKSYYQFLGSFFVGVAKNCQIFLGNSQWKPQEWKQVLSIVKPDLIIHETDLEIISSSPSSLETETTIMIPTGGSSGNIRFVKHNWKTLSASVTGFSRHFETEKVNCFCLLPLYHVSGLMQLMRALLTDGNLIVYPYKTIETAWRNQDLPTLENLETFPQQDYFISLVPTQLQRLINFGAGHWLSQFKCVLLGGAPAWESLLETGRKYNIPIALTYGMTETASQIVTLKPDDFLAGNNSVGKVLPHTKISIRGEAGERLTKGKVGRIAIESESLGLSYYPDSDWNREEFVTDDLGYFDEENYLYIVGRNSRKIITGGENVFPDEVEAMILSIGLVTDVYVMGLEDQNWGEVISAIYVPKEDSITSSEIETKLKQYLSPYKIPKQWLAVKALPRNEQGKVNHRSVLSLWNNSRLGGVYETQHQSPKL